MKQIKDLFRITFENVHLKDLLFCCFEFTGVGLKPLTQIKYLKLKGMVFHSFISWLYFNQDKSGRLAALGLCFGETTKEEISHQK